jgi:hypothetical protein
MRIQMVTCHECGGAGKQPAADVGPLLKAERIKRGIGLRQMERALDISRTYLTDLEKGTRRVTSKIASAYLEQLEKLGGRNGDR